MQASVANRTVVTPGLDPGIHSVALAALMAVTEWIAGSSPAMTTSLGAVHGED
jgi:hypothetical protein